MTYSLPQDLAGRIRRTLEDWKTGGKIRKLWAKDPFLWTGADEDRWLGWLDLPAQMPAQMSLLKNLAGEVLDAGFSQALLLGMGGSSLCPEVLKMTFGKVRGYPELFVLDSTDPAQVRAFEDKVDCSRTLFIVSSKSGTTLEPDILRLYFFERAQQTLGRKEAGKRFIAVTDPKSQLHQIAERDGYRRVFLGSPSVGGRYSALSHFGMVPSAVMGLDVHKILDRAGQMAAACSARIAPEENPGVLLGILLGESAKAGWDKVTLVASPRIWSFGAWLEQLLAESTGKQGKAIIPVDQERLGPPEAYGRDRLFVYLRLEDSPDTCQDAAVGALEKAGRPVVRISLFDPYDLGGEFFRWEAATAVAGSVLGIHPFDQPDVEAGKVETKKLTAEFEKTGSLPEEVPLLQEGRLRLFADRKNAADLERLAGGDRGLSGYLRAHLGRLRAGDYFALLAYLPMNEMHLELLQSVRHAVRDGKHSATCLGFGPRYLHSTGQAYKGGPNTGVFLQLTCEDAADVPVPGRRYSFGVVKAAQARGDFQVLAERDRRVLRIHLDSDVRGGLETLKRAVLQALS